MSNSVNQAEVLSDRYRIIQELGQGSFGRTYLAEDINRFRERCILKEFAPQIKGEFALKKAEELFEQESGILYKLKHSQIPNFRELLRIKQEGRVRLFLVQDYIAGQSCKSALQARLQQGLRFSESEVIELLLNILPVLQYIHLMGVIHRDISPENIILRETDGLPVLIEFGGVKQVALSIASQFLLSETEIPLATSLGKEGYAPVEQLHQGIFSPPSDLYALAVSALVLLIGKEPQEFINPQTRHWEWRKYISLSSRLSSVLDRMLARSPGDRFQSAVEVIQALRISPPLIPTFPQSTPEETTQPVEKTTIAEPETSDPNSESSSEEVVISKPKFGVFAKIGIVLGTIVGAGFIGWMAGNAWVQQQLETDISNPLTVSFPPIMEDTEPEPSLELSPEERRQRASLRERRLQLGIDYRYYIDLVNQNFWKQYPDQRGRVLSDSEEDTEWRGYWNTIAGEWLEKLSFLSMEARRDLGNYNQSSRDRWIQQVNQLRLSSRALYDLADASFFSHFPEQEEEEFMKGPVGQIWNAVVFDTLQSLRSGDTLERLAVSGTKRVSGTIEPGKGKAYITRLQATQDVDIQLATEADVLFSIYSPTGGYKMLERSSEHSWSGTLPETGFYELVITSSADEPVNYRLLITAEDLPETEG